MEKGLVFAKNLTSIYGGAITASLLLLAAPSHGDDCLARSLEALNRTVEDTRTAYVSPEVHARVRETFSDASLTQRQQARRAFELILEARLRLIPSAQAEAVRSAYRNVRFVADPLLYRRGSYSPQTNQVTVATMKELEESLTYFTSMTHELEHSLQQSVALSHLEGGIGSPAIYTSPETQFLLELGALRAEWAYLSAIPEEVRLQAIEDIRVRTDGIPGRTPKIWIRCLENASCDVNTYIEREHAAGRGSREVAERTAAANAEWYEAQRQRRNARNESAARATLIAGAVFLSAQAFCEFMVNYEETHPNERQTFSRICAQLPGREQK